MVFVEPGIGVIQSYAGKCGDSLVAAYGNVGQIVGRLMTEKLIKYMDRYMFVKNLKVVHEKNVAFGVYAVFAFVRLYVPDGK